MKYVSDFGTDPFPRTKIPIPNFPKPKKPDGLVVWIYIDIEKRDGDGWGKPQSFFVDQQKRQSTGTNEVRLGMPETTEATRSPIWADVVAVEVRDWISGIEPRYRLSLGRKFVIEFS